MAPAPFCIELGGSGSAVPAIWPIASQVRYQYAPLPARANSLREAIG
ncbi:hypothetical protein NG799_25815 [Laspinema sp. D1]|uniref:Uncharacterized protein n=1 Tax=Laspinema palackyanum D2a TaxID=2953684 RepID=A0ABT2MYA4_9CYAN|nr:hypothetical protein [Laspinema sp. D2a]